MSGHSKWATIHRAKEVKDAKKGAAFTKLANAITIAVREGGGIPDPDQNFKLRLVVDKARQVNMPKDNIQRAIDRAAGSGAEAFTEALFEGFLPGGAGVLVQTVSDNKLRSQQQVREIIEKSGGNMANSGAVSYQFKLLGELNVVNPSKGKDDIELELIDEGVEEYEIDDSNGWFVWVEKNRLAQVREDLEKKGYEIKEAELTMKPGALVEVSDLLVKERIESILERLEDLDDVSHVWTNYA